MKKSKSGSTEGKGGDSPSQLIDARIKELIDWRGETLDRVRALIKEADPEVVEEWKWRGVPVWSHAGIICTGDHEGDKIDEKALKALIRAAVAMNTSVRATAGRVRSQKRPKSARGAS